MQQTATRLTVADVRNPADRLELGGRLMALAGLAVVLYGVAFLIVDFTTFTEVGLTAGQVGGTPGGIAAYSIGLYHYISHLQVAISGFIVAVGLQLVGMAWYGVRRGQRWALNTSVLALAAGYLIAVPLHFVYGFATLVHLGPFGLVALAFFGGAWIAHSGMAKAAA